MISASRTAEFPDLGPLVPVNRKKLAALVEAKTPFNIDEFERLVGWSFHREAPAEKRKLAWELLGLSRKQLDNIKELTLHFPQAYAVKVQNVAGAADRGDLVPARRDGAA